MLALVLLEKPVFLLDEIVDGLQTGLEHLLEVEVVLFLQLEIGRFERCQSGFGNFHILVGDPGAQYLLLERFNFLILGFDEGFDVLFWGIVHFFYLLYCTRISIPPF